MARQGTAPKAPRGAPDPASGESVDVFEVVAACGGDFEAAERALREILAAKLKEGGNSRAAQAEVLRLSKQLGELRRLKGNPGGGTF